MTPIRKLAIVAAVQIVILLGIVGFKQVYTVWTGTTVLLAVESVDPGGDGDITVRYAISAIDLGRVAGDDELWDATVYVELQEGADGIWGAVAIHNSHDHWFEGTVVLKGKLRDDYYPVSGRPVSIRYNLEELSVPDAGGRDIPRERAQVEIKVDGFGNNVPRHLLVDGEKLDLKRR